MSRCPDPDGPKWYAPTLDALPHMAWVAAADGAVEYANRRCRDYAGLPLDDLLGWDWGWVVHPSDLPRTLDAWAEAIRTGGGYSVEYRLRRSDGLFRWHLGRAVPVRGPDGQVLRWFGTCTDIEAQKLAEDGLRAAGSLLRALVERSEEGYALLAADRTVRYISPAVSRILGSPPEEFVGQDAWEWVHPDDRAGLSGWLEDLLGRPGERAGAVARVRHRDGSYRRLAGRGTNLLPDPDVRAVAVTFWEAADEGTAPGPSGLN
jgi:PAS domain S-box-containing protein